MKSSIYILCLEQGWLSPNIREESEGGRGGEKKKCIYDRWLERETLRIFFFKCLIRDDDEGTG